MAQITIVIDDKIKNAIENLYGGTIDEHIETIINKTVDKWKLYIKETIRKERMDKFDRLAEAEQNQIQAILDTAPDPIEE